MNGFVYIIPTRNDLSGINVQVLDLLPNTALRSALDVPGQTFYVRSGPDQPGPTLTAQGALVGGSLTTNPLGALATFDYDGTGTYKAMAVAQPEYGLGAYLRDRCCVDPPGAARALSPTEVSAVLPVLFQAAAKGQPLTQKAVEAALAAAAGMRVDLAPADAASPAFGSVADVLRLLGGATYLVQPGTPVTDMAGKFHSLAKRKALAGALPQGLAPATSGSFLTTRAPGYRGARILGLTDALLASYAMGDLAVLRAGGREIKIQNPAYAYDAAHVASYRPRAVMLDGTPVPPDGVTQGVFQVYLEDGTPL